MKKILLFALPLMVMCTASCEKDKEEVWTDDSPIIQFKDPKFLEAVLKPYNAADKNSDGQIPKKRHQLLQSY